MFKKSKIALVTAAVAAMFTLSGCLGDSNNASDTFVCVKTVHKYNTGVISQNKWVNEILFIIPGGLCYGVAGFLDVIVFNSFHFWTGDNPVASTTITDDAGVQYRVVKTDSTLTITNLSTDEVAEFALSEDGKTLSVTANGTSSTFAELVASNRALVNGTEVVF